MYVFDEYKSTNTRTYFRIFAFLPKNSNFPTSACSNWIGPSKLYKVDLSFSLFSMKSTLVGVLSSFSRLLSAKSISFNKRVSFPYLDFFNFFNNRLPICSSENKTLFGSVFKLLNMLLACLKKFYLLSFRFKVK